METKPKNKSGKKIIFIILAVILVLCIAAGGFFAFKYVFPSDKDLFLIAHANLLNKDEKEISVYKKNIDLSFDFDGEFLTKKAVDTVKSITVSTESIQLEDRSAYDFNMQFLNKEFLSFSNVKNEETEFLTVPQLMEETYAANDVDDILSILLGSESAADIDIFEGVNKEKLKEYLKKYGTELYDNIPANSFTKTQSDTGKILTFKDSVNRMLYDIVNEIKNDIELRDFLYEQTSIVYTNFNAKFPYAGTLLTVPEKSEYDENYKESLDEFIKSIENAEIEIVTHIEGKKIISETIKILDEDGLLYDISYDENDVDFIQYKDSLENIHYSYTKKIEGTKTHKNTVFTIDVNEWTKEQADGQKNFSVVIDTTTDTNVTEKITIPENYINVMSLTEEEKTAIQETAGKNLTELLTSFTLTLLML